MQKSRQQELKREVKAKDVKPKRAGFTLVQLITALAVISLLGAGTFTIFSRGRAAAQRAGCDAHLKTIALALDAHRQEYGKYPKQLQDLVGKKYLAAVEEMHCPADPDPEGTYEPFYVPRAPRDHSELPTVVCPFHEQLGVGEQVYLGRYVKQFATKPARLTAANGVTVQSPGGRPTAGTAGMELRGADIVRTGPSGMAVIEFADGSTATLRSDAQVTLLQSFIAGQVQAPLYTLVRQLAGTVSYQIHTGSKFDVVTPTATAGALGTRFDITVSGSGTSAQTSILLHEGKVRLTTVEGSWLAPLGSLYTINALDLVLDDLLNLTNGLLPNVPLLPNLPNLPLPNVPLIPGL